MDSPKKEHKEIVTLSSVAEQELQVIISRYQAILAAVPDIIMEVDENKIYTWANQAGFDFFGEDVIGKAAAYYFEGEQETYEVVKPIFNGSKNVIYLESWQRRKDGEKRLLAWWCRVLKDVDDKVTGTISTARDITAQRTTEQQLRWQNRQFTNTLESLSHPFYVIDANNYQIIIANSATNMFGSISQKSTCYEFAHGQKQPCNGKNYVCPLQKVKRTKQPVMVEHIHFDKAGAAQHFEIHGFPIFDDAGEVVQMIEYSLDSTERKRIENALLESEQRFRTITQTASDAIITIDRQGKIQFWNRAAEKIFGYTIAEIRNAPVTRLMPERLRLAHQSGMNRVVTTGKSKIIGKTVEMTGLGKDGREFPIELSISSWQANGEIYFTGIVRDVTERHEMEAALKKSHRELERRVADRTSELEQANAALRAEFMRHKRAEAARKAAERKLEQHRTISMRSDRLRSLGQMAAGIAHELNQPLVGVRGLAEHLLIGMNRGWEITEPRLKEKLALIIEQADRMSHIIEHVRLFAREAGKPELHRVPVNEVVRSAIDLLGAQLHSRGLALVADLCPTDGIILANPFSLEEVILNLIINARDAVEKKLRLKSDCNAPCIFLTTALASIDAQQMLKIQVIDNGMGIKAKLIPKLFDPFFSTKDPDKGTGLGLSISKSIIEQFHGTIDIQSVYKQGTTVTITLPLAEE